VGGGQLRCLARRVLAHASDEQLQLSGHVQQGGQVPDHGLENQHDVRHRCDVARSGRRDVRVPRLLLQHAVAYYEVRDAYDGRGDDDNDESNDDDNNRPGHNNDQGAIDDSASAAADVRRKALLGHGSRWSRLQLDWHLHRRQLPLWFADRLHLRAKFVILPV